MSKSISNQALAPVGTGGGGTGMAAAVGASGCGVGVGVCAAATVTSAALSAASKNRGKRIEGKLRNLRPGEGLESEDNSTGLLAENTRIENTQPAQAGQDGIHVTRVHGSDPHPPQVAAVHLRMVHVHAAHAAVLEAVGKPVCVGFVGEAAGLNDRVAGRLNGFLGGNRG